MEGKDIGSPLMGSDDDDQGTSKKNASEDLAKTDEGKEGPINPKLSPA